MNAKQNFKEKMMILGVIPIILIVIDMIVTIGLFSTYGINDILGSSECSLIKEKFKIEFIELQKAVLRIGILLTIMFTIINTIEFCIEYFNPTFNLTLGKKIDSIIIKYSTKVGNIYSKYEVKRNLFLQKYGKILLIVFSIIFLMFITYVYVINALLSNLC